MGTAPATAVEPERTSFVELNRTSLRLWEWGDPSRPAVVFVHGASDHGRMWDEFAPRVAALGYRSVAFDMRGHGDSGPLSSGMMWAVAAIDLGQLALHLGSPVGLIGHSFGGDQATYASALWPDRFRWVVNLDGLGPGTPESDEKWSIAEDAQRTLDSAARLLLGHPRVYSSLAEMVERRQKINIRLPAEWTEHLVRHGSTPVEGGWRWKSDPMFRWGTPSEFNDQYLDAEHSLVSAPVLILTGGEADTWSELPVEAIEARVANFRDARHHVIEGAGHYVHLEQPDAVLAHVAAFAAEIDGVGG